MPSPNVHFDDRLNDIAMRQHAYSVGTALYQSVGAVRAQPILDIFVI
jgi:hypothetical protein